jgi:hypothetical protein
MTHFLIYVGIGVCAEILWTAVYDVVAGCRVDPADPRNRLPLSREERWRLEGRTYLWMFPLYGFAGLALEPWHDAMRGAPWLVRGLAWVATIFAIEYACGWAIHRAVGRCPWDYSYARWHVRGLIRLDYVPVWFCAGLLFERLHDALTAAG